MTHTRHVTSADASARKPQRLAYANIARQIWSSASWPQDFLQHRTKCAEATNAVRKAPSKKNAIREGFTVAEDEPQHCKNSFAHACMINVYASLLCLNCFLQDEALLLILPLTLNRCTLYASYK